MLTLPNQKHINIDKLKKALADFDPAIRYFLDSETGEIISGLNYEAEAGIRYFQVPKLSSDIMIPWMKDFVDDMLLYDCPDLFYKLKGALKMENPTKMFMEILSNHECGWIHGWSQWEADHWYEEAVDWLDSLEMEIYDDMSELDDDCPLCRMMKEGVTDYETIKKGFQEANAKQMVNRMFIVKD